MMNELDKCWEGNICPDGKWKEVANMSPLIFKNICRKCKNFPRGQERIPGYVKKPQLREMGLMAALGSKKLILQDVNKNTVELVIIDDFTKR
jgi:hypothetical protein